MNGIIKWYLLVVGDINGAEEKLRINGFEEDAIEVAEDVTNSMYDYCYIYELNDEYPNGRKEVNFIYHEH